MPAKRRKGNGGASLVVRGNREHNRKGIYVSFSRGAFVAVTGEPGADYALEGAEHIDKIIEFDQSPIGRLRGYKPGRFSFNVKGGRCEHRKGDGILKLEMQFLPEAYVTCECARAGTTTARPSRSITRVARSPTSSSSSSAALAIRTKLQTLHNVGLENVHQPATTLSGGEAQRADEAGRGVQAEATARGRP